MPCGYGFYNNKTDSTSASDCLPCPEGKYCFAGIFNCPRGYYCMENSLPKEPWPGFSAPTEGLSEPVECTAGYYQPVTQYKMWEWQGITGCLTCPRYRFCDVSKLTEPAGECDDGWECGRGETSPRPTGKECTPGSYCVKGRKFQCDVGYYQPYANMHTCFECPEGMQCLTKGLSAPTGVCPSGYYCRFDKASKTTLTYPCPAGYMCPNGIKIPCGKGHYQDETQQTTCKRCPVGKYCSGVAQTSVSGSCTAGCCLEDGQIQPSRCPRENPTNCTRGYYTVDDICTLCPEGRYCAVSGHSGSTGYCEDGWYCEEGETSPAPNGKYCPAGHKCIRGIKTPCGYESLRYMYQPKVGQASCVPCPEHFNCTEPGKDRLEKLCDPGYDCKAGLMTSCANGSYCYGGKSIVCRDGFKTTEEGQSSCVRCDPGYYCVNGTQLPCPANRICYNGLAHYCELGFTCSIVNGELVKTPCAPGTERYEIESDTCVPCRQHRYCRSGASYECFRYHKGFACSGGAATPFSTVAQPGKHYELFYETYEKNRGYLIIDCAPGTYQPDKHRRNCLPCPAQHYCPLASTVPLACPGDQPLEGQSQC
ncbi:sushi, von Willebrand factor type A, EGF and pentraxin domain-containing protein 1-like [Mercenaria mercenaria]|uniref:sushi, von Willebrand factor type A, EGF and pentraxin domain-containing protein 1-like n=1 Tax=Mercenaria mercenaria TaxID=6596 RepID=UPI00234F4848|nr:sushi, von Willebrand factor type A, EGF and pentraxin domain-containing protein 1-like [Mercenaria mercenaria]